MFTAEEFFDHLSTDEYRYVVQRTNDGDWVGLLWGSDMYGFALKLPPSSSSWPDIAEALKERTQV